MKRNVLLPLVLLFIAIGCSTTPQLEKVAFSRIPKALEKAMQEDLSLPGGARIVSPEVLYSCDSLCIIQFKAVAKDPKEEGYSFPVRYVFVQDMVMSHAYGHPVYSEKISGAPEMTPEEIQQAKAEFQRDADKLYPYYSATSTLISPEDL